MSALWIVFAIGVLTHPHAWVNVPIVKVQTGWDVFFYIIGMNGIILLLITVGNLFVRFGAITPGLVILAWNAVNIGWTAGTNGFAEPFSSVALANAAFVRIGLWETTAYVLICAVTLNKSLHISDSFPAKQWTEIRKLRDLRFTSSEAVLAVVSIASVLGAGIVEAFYRR
jgi:hypothetical protein